MDSQIDIENDTKWLVVNEFSDVRISLLHLVGCLEKTDTDQTIWKWAILSAHSALQGACVCILTGTDGTGALSKRSEKETKKYLYGESEGRRNLNNPTVKYPDPQTASLPELLERLPNELALKLPDRTDETYGWDTAGDIRRLHEFRNGFVHFKSAGWSIEITGLPRIISSAVDMTKRLIRAGNYRRVNKFRDLNLEPIFDHIETLLINQPS